MATTREKLDAKLADYRAAKAGVRNEQTALLETEDNLAHAQAAQELIQGVAQAVQQEAHRRIAGVVTRCLETVFDTPYCFDIEFERKRGRTEANLRFVRGKNSVDPMTASGGGVVDVAAFALRLACLVLARPPLRRLLILDEPGKMISEQFVPRVAELLETLAEEMDLQVILVTHNTEFQVGKVVRL